jgi:hypothetical protein
VLVYPTLIAAIAVVAGLTAASGLWVALDMPTTLRRAADLALSPTRG